MALNSYLCIVIYTRKKDSLSGKIGVKNITHRVPEPEGMVIFKDEVYIDRKTEQLSPWEQ